MRLQNLEIQNFRNIETASLEFPPGPQLLVGQNAQGKTSLLEAVYFLATATSHRTRKNRELIRKGASTAFVKTEFETEERTSTLSAGLEEKTRRFRLDGDELVRSGDLYGHLRCVFFSPEDIELVSGAPASRRRFLDLGLCQKQPTMIRALLEYRRTLKQRNAILKRGGPGSDTRASLEAWAPELARLGGIVLRNRAVYALDLLDRAALHYTELTGSTETLGGEYRTGGLHLNLSKKEDAPSAEEFQAMFEESLAKNLDRDLNLRATTTGPHRDDLHLEVAAISASRYASQGQRRSLALALKLAERDLLGDEKEPPILLVDDVTHEMDAGRCRRFLEMVSNQGQAFLTFTELAERRTVLEGATVWNVEGGRFGR